MYTAGRDTVAAYGILLQIQDRDFVRAIASAVGEISIDEAFTALEEQAAREAAKPVDAVARRDDRSTGRPRA